MLIDNIKYYTNITDPEKLQKCKDFLSVGCNCYAISFENHPSFIIRTSSVKGFRINYLRNMNFSQCFIPEKIKDLNDSEEVASKGYDLIEIICY